MKLIEAISNLENIDEDNVLYVRKIEGEFRSDSDCVLLILTEEELEWDTQHVAERKCPGYDYFLEVFIIQEFLEDLKGHDGAEEKCKRIIRYAVYDA